MLHFTFQNMRAFYGPWPRGLGLKFDDAEYSLKFIYSRPAGLQGGVSSGVHCQCAGVSYKLWAFIHAVQELLPLQK